MNKSNLKNYTIQNSMIEEYDISDSIDLLNTWTIAKVEPKLVYKLGTFEKLSLKQVVKTSEESIHLHRNEFYTIFMDSTPKIDFSKGFFARQKINYEFYLPK